MTKDLHEVRAAAEAFVSGEEIRRIERTVDMKLHEEAINWGDLHCVRAESWTDDSGESGLRVYIEEAAPDSYRLRELVSEHLRPVFGEVEVSVEW